MHNDHVKMPEQPCLSCGHIVDACTAADAKHQPKEGDVSICIRCAYPQQFDENLHHAHFSPHELISIMHDREVLTSIIAVWVAKSKMTYEEKAKLREEIK